MPNIKSAKKRLLTSEKARQRNMAVKTRVKTCRREFLNVVEGDDKAVAEEAYRNYCSVLDKAGKCGVVKRNTLIRRKGRAADKIRAMA